MKHVDTRETGEFFDVVGETERSQAATMTLDPGQSTGGPENRHPDSDQWCYVVSGAGSAVVDGESTALEAGSLVCIEAGETHEITGEGDEPLRTINVYAPPTY